MHVSCRPTCLRYTVQFYVKCSLCRCTQCILSHIDTVQQYDSPVCRKVLLLGSEPLCSEACSDQKMCFESTIKTCRITKAYFATLEHYKCVSINNQDTSYHESLLCNFGTLLSWLFPGHALALLLQHKPVGKKLSKEFTQCHCHCQQQKACQK